MEAASKSQLWPWSQEETEAQSESLAAVKQHAGTRRDRLGGCTSTCLVMGTVVAFTLGYLGSWPRAFA